MWVFSSLAVLSMRRIQTRRPMISVLGTLFLYYFLEYCLLCVLSFFFVFSFWDAYYLDHYYPGWILQLSSLSYFQSIYSFALLSHCSPHVPNTVLFKTFWGSVNFHFQEVCLILSLIFHCFFLHSDFGFGYAVSSYLSDIKFLEVQKMY